MDYPHMADDVLNYIQSEIPSKSVDIIAHSLNINRSEIFSTEAPGKVVNNSNKIILQQDIDDLYETRIKAIYAAIVEFISESQSSMSTEQTEKLFLLREVGRDIVEIVKGIKHLQKNLKSYLNSTNPDISEEYNKIRLQICRVLQELDALQVDEDESVTILSLDQLKMEISERDIITTGALDRLIRERRISAQMAISLMNDSAYCQDICRNLIHMGSILFASSERDDETAENEVALDETEIKEVLDRYTEETS